MEREIMITDGEGRIYIPLSLLLTSEFFRSQYEAVDDFGDVLDTNDYNLGLWPFVKILTYDMSRGGIKLSANELEAMDKLIMKTSLAHFADRKIVSGSDSRQLYADVKDNAIPFDSLLFEFQEAVIFEAILAGYELYERRYFNNDHLKFVDQHIDLILDRIIRNPWLFYPNYMFMYTRYFNQISEQNVMGSLRDKFSEDEVELFENTILNNITNVPHNLSSTYKDRLPEVLFYGVEPYLIEYINDPTSFKGGMSKDIFVGANGEEFILTHIISFSEFDLAKRLISNGLNINARTSSNSDLLERVLDYTEGETSDYLREIEFLLDNGFDISMSSKNIFLTLSSFTRVEVYDNISKILQKISPYKSKLQEDYDTYMSYNSNTSNQIFNEMLSQYYSSDI